MPANPEYTEPVPLNLHVLPDPAPHDIPYRGGIDGVVTGEFRLNGAPIRSPTYRPHLFRGKLAPAVPGSTRRVAVPRSICGVLLLCTSQESVRVDVIGDGLLVPHYGWEVTMQEIKRETMRADLDVLNGYDPVAILVGLPLPEPRQGKVVRTIRVARDIGAV